MSSTAPVRLEIDESVGASLTGATSMLTCTGVEELPVPSKATIVNAAKTPFAFVFPFHWSLSPDEIIVAPGITGVHAKPIRFSSVVPAEILSILKLGNEVSTSASFADSASSPYDISLKVSSNAPESVETEVKVGLSFIGVTLIKTGTAVFDASLPS